LCFKNHVFFSSAKKKFFKNVCPIGVNFISLSSHAYIRPTFETGQGRILPILAIFVNLSGIGPQQQLQIGSLFKFKKGELIFKKTRQLFFLFYSPNIYRHFYSKYLFFVLLKMCLIRFGDVDLYESKTCRSIKDIELWSKSLLEEESR